jgi:hypothetical protein
MSGFGKDLLEDLKKLHGLELAQLEPNLGAGSMPVPNTTSQVDLEQNIRSRLRRDFIRLFPIGDYRNSDDYEHIAGLLSETRLSDLEHTIDDRLPTPRWEAQKSLTEVDDEQPAPFVRGGRYMPEPQPPFKTQEELDQYRTAILHNFKIDFENEYAESLDAAVEYCLDYEKLTEIESFITAVNDAHAVNKERLRALNEKLEDEKNIEALKSLTEKSFDKATLEDLSKYLDRFRSGEKEKIQEISYLIDQLYFGNRQHLKSIQSDRNNSKTLEWVTLVHRFKDALLIPVTRTKAIEDFLHKKHADSKLPKHVDQLASQSHAIYFLELPDLAQAPSNRKKKPW